MYHIFFIRPYADGHLGCFYTLVVNNASVSGAGGGCRYLLGLVFLYSKEADMTYQLNNNNLFE